MKAKATDRKGKQMEKNHTLITFAILALTMSSLLLVQATGTSTEPTTVYVQLESSLDGQTTFTSEKNYTALCSARLVIPTGAREGSNAYALYSYNKPLSSISSFSIYTSFTKGLPRLLITLDKNNDTLMDSVLLSDYQNASSNGDWKSMTAGNNWRWTESDYALTNFDQSRTFESWKSTYGNASVLHVGICLDYWAVEPDGFGYPLYADKLIINGVYYKIAPASWLQTVTPSPSITPKPTMDTDPIQTPTPKPTAIPKPMPSLNLSCSSSATDSSFKVDIIGTLTGNGTGLSGAPIVIYYSLTGGNSWVELTFVNTREDGSFSALWLPTATGNFIVKAHFTGDSQYSQVKTKVDLAITPFTNSEDTTIFSVSSNSTLSELLFNSQSKELRFTVSGESNTVGYVDAYVPKSLINDISTLRVYLDDKPINCTIASQEYSWLMHFTYHHSTHQVTMTLDTLSEQPNVTLENWAFYAGIAIAATCVLAVSLIAVKRKRINQ
jgi:hypothetical protein